jgi:flagellar hook-basal body complex protein FliE
MSLPPIAPISGIQSVAGSSPIHGARPGARTDQLFARLLDNANSDQRASELATQQLATGQTDSIQNVVVSAARADLSFRLVLEIRNKLIEAYQEIMRMQV